MLQEKGQPIDKIEIEDGMSQSLFKSVLPPDMDSNQTLTASCRADVWAGATFKTRRYRTTRDRWQGNNSKAIRHMGRNIAEHKKEQSRTKSKESTRGLCGCTGTFRSPQRSNRDF